jgi:fatty acid desaturase
VIRFAILAPLSWVVPPLRRLTVERCSALVINHLYVRRVPLDRAAHVEEAAAALLCWTAIALWWTGVVPGAALAAWLLVSAIASAVNVVRTLAAHLYDQDVDHEISLVSQLLDSCTIAPADGVAGAIGAAWRELWAPVGLRFHALHHWIPSLPYHNLARAHRVLATTLGADAPYAATEHRTIAEVVIDLFRRAARSRPQARRS